LIELRAAGPDTTELRAALPPAGDASAIAEGLLDVCLADGFGDARVEVRGEQANWFASIDPGPRWRLGEVRFSGSSLFSSDDLRARSDLRRGAPFHAEAVRRDLDQLLEEWGARGHLFARFEVHPQRAADAHVDLRIWVEDGPPVYLGRVVARGNQVTQVSTLRRAARLRSGELIDTRVLTTAADRLRRLGYFARVAEPRLLRGAAADTLDLELSVEEAATHAIEGVLGYAPAEAGRTGRLTGFLHLSLHNIFGSGRELDLNWERIAAEEFTLDAVWRERWIFGSAASVLLNFAQVVQDSTYLEDRFGLDLTTPFGRKSEASLRFSRSRVVPGRRADRLVPAASRTRSVGFGWRHDGRDHALNPRRGLRIDATTDFGRRERRTLVRSALFGVLHLPGMRRQSWAFGVRLLSLEGTPGSIATPDLFRVGGSRTLRGYQEGSMRAARGGIGTAELRFHTAAASRVFLFADLGHLRLAGASDEGTAFVWKTRMGYGLGARIGSNAGLLSIDYGVAAGDPISSGKIHLGMRNLF
jgi:outer membrane protein assembly factor BamA